MPATPTAERLRRILVMVPWVMARKGATVNEVCERFGITRQQLGADIDLLFLCGLPPFGPGDLIVAMVDGEDVIIEAADYLVRPPRLTREEATTLLVMGRAVAALPGVEEAGSLESALEKLSRAIAPADASETAAVAERVKVDLALGARFLGQVRGAAQDRATIRIAYFSAGRGEMSERDVDPWGVFHSRGTWYLQAYDHASGEERTFRLDRIQVVERTGGTFAPPGDFDVRARSEGPLVRPSERDHVAQIEFAPEAAWLREAIHAEQEEDAGDGWTRLTIRTSHFAWLVRLLLGAGERARVVAPPALSEELRATAQRALRLYE